MKNKINILLAAAVMLCANLAFAANVQVFQKPSSEFERPAKPDKFKPSRAENIQLVKKSTVEKSEDVKKFDELKKERPARPSRFAATGILGEPSAGERYAIIIGISDYPGTAYDLQYADDDAIDMKKALVENYGFADSNIILLTDLSATRAAILTAIENVGNRASNKDEVIFFFSGHGMSGEADDGDNEKLDESIVAHDGVNLVPMWDGELKAVFASFQTPRIVFVFDSCLSGGMTDLSASGRIINMASSEKGVAYEYASLGNGQFTYYFVEMGMLNGLADRYDHDKDGILREGADVVIEEAFDFAKQRCFRQTPVISDLFANDLLL